MNPSLTPQTLAELPEPVQVTLATRGLLDSQVTLGGNVNPLVYAENVWQLPIVKILAEVGVTATVGMAAMAAC